VLFRVWAILPKRCRAAPLLSSLFVSLTVAPRRPNKTLCSPSVPNKQKTDFNMYTEALKTIVKPQFASVFA
jgi:hypothetical protein